MKEPKREKVVSKYKRGHRHIYLFNLKTFDMTYSVKKTFACLKCHENENYHKSRSFCEKFGYVKDFLPAPLPTPKKKKR